MGKRVIALEKLMKMQPGQEITNQDELIREVIHSVEPETTEDEEPEEKGMDNVVPDDVEGDTLGDADNIQREQSRKSEEAREEEDVERKENVVEKEEDAI